MTTVPNNERGNQSYMGKHSISSKTLPPTDNNVSLKNNHVITDFNWLIVYVNSGGTLYLRNMASSLTAIHVRIQNRINIINGFGNTCNNSKPWSQNICVVD
jgi:hypothetical protein